MSYALNAKAGYHDGDADTNYVVASTLKSQRGKDGGGIGPEETLVAETVGSHNSGVPMSQRIYEGLAPTLSSSNSPNRGGSEGPMIAAPLSHGSNPNSNAAGRRREDDENLVTAFSHTQGLDAQPSDSAWPTLRVEGGGHAVGLGASVRRLTPTECERLQALPDGWTDLGGTPDSRRYAALGDAVTSSVSYWIGCRIRDAA